MEARQVRELLERLRASEVLVVDAIAFSATSKAGLGRAQRELGEDRGYSGGSGEAHPEKARSARPGWRWREAFIVQQRVARLPRGRSGAVPEHPPRLLNGTRQGRLFDGE